MPDDKTLAHMYGIGYSEAFQGDPHVDDPKEPRRTLEWLGRVGRGRFIAQEGFRSGTGRPFTTNIVKQLRYAYSIPSGCPGGLAGYTEGYRADGRCPPGSLPMV